MPPINFFEYNVRQQKRAQSQTIKQIGKWFCNSCGDRLSHGQTEVRLFVTGGYCYNATAAAVKGFTAANWTFAVVNVHFVATTLLLQLKKKKHDSLLRQNKFCSDKPGSRFCSCNSYHVCTYQNDHLWRQILKSNRLQISAASGPRVWLFAKVDIYRCKKTWGSFNAAKSNESQQNWLPFWQSSEQPKFSMQIPRLRQQTCLHCKRPFRSDKVLQLQISNSGSDRQC